MFFGLDQAHVSVLDGDKHRVRASVVLLGVFMVIELYEERAVGVLVQLLRGHTAQTPKRQTF